ncbi:unnamed protein product [Anisakis simplex]|uniref:Mediator of RNA polymerase II transcription subunit 13 n=1 Tax=Anisakis simplex TaxID=6269 RepID=A0A0M3JRI7_ANISI|nr:unnamed protein product [Anisakis simplex]
MGQQVSSFPKRPKDFTYFCLTFHVTDSIVLVDASEEVISMVRSVVSQLSAAGIQSESQGPCGAYKFKLRGMPFVTSSREISVQTKLMLCELLKVLRENGWELTLSSDLSRRRDLSTLFFQKIPNNGYEYAFRGCHIMCLSLSSMDRLQLVNAPVEANNILIECVDTLHQRDHSGQNYFEVQMKGYLWEALTAEGGFQARSLLLNTFSRFHELRYRFYGTANIKGTADCIFFISDRDDVGQREYCMLSLNASDRLRLVCAPNEVVDLVGECLQRYWVKGIQHAKVKGGDPLHFEYKLGGFPWNSMGTEAVESRLLITIILQQLVTIGWAVVTAIDLSRRATDKAVFLLRRCAASTIPHFAICPAETDKLRVINANKEMIEVVGNVLRSCWTLGIQREEYYGNSFEYKLVGYPWSSTVSSLTGDHQYELCRMMMISLIDELGRHGWRVICSADVSSKYIKSNNSSEEHPLDVHSWFIAYTADISAPQSQSTSAIPQQFPTAPLVAVDALPPSYDEAVSNTAKSSSSSPAKQ